MLSSMPTDKNRFSTRCPELIFQWHPTKNGNLIPDMVSYGSHKKVWWICKKNHEWKAPITSMSKLLDSSGCPYCAGKRVLKENSLFVLTKKTPTSLVSGMNWRIILFNLAPRYTF